MDFVKGPPQYKRYSRDRIKGYNLGFRIKNLYKKEKYCTLLHKLNIIFYIL